MLKKLFGLDSAKTTVRTEILAGITTFLTMAYILAVNPSLFSRLEGMPTGSVFTATALAAIAGTLVMAFWAKLPFALAPGMGLNAFFVFTICLGMEKSWQFALTAVFIEGLLFILMTITNLRTVIVNAIPTTLKNAIGAGIGLYIAFIGMQNAGIIVDNKDTLVQLGTITEGPALLAFIGLFLTGALVALNVRGAMLIGILATTIIGIPMGITTYGGILSMPTSIAPICCQFQWDQVLSWDMLIIVFTFLFVDMFGSLGTLVGICLKANMVGKDGKIPRINQAFMADAVATTIGSVLGASTTTTYVESAAGVTQGGRSGLTAFVVACCFGISLFFSPIFLSIPSAATAPVLIIVGLFMLEPIIKLPFTEYNEAIPAFVCVALMPLTYSISDGILLGMICYVVLNMLCGKFKRLTIPMYILALLFILKYIFITPASIKKPEIAPQDAVVEQTIPESAPQEEPMEVVPLE